MDAVERGERLGGCDLVDDVIDTQGRDQHVGGRHFCRLERRQRMLAAVAAGGNELPADGLAQTRRQRLCEAAGQGFILMPGTDACSGRVADDEQAKCRALDRSRPRRFGQAQRSRANASALQDQQGTERDLREGQENFEKSGARFWKKA
jgi:hypothetical protein